MGHCQNDNRQKLERILLSMGFKDVSQFKGSKNRVWNLQTGQTETTITINDFSPLSFRQALSFIDSDYGPRRPLQDWAGITTTKQNGCTLIANGGENTPTVFMISSPVNFTPSES